MQEIIAEMMGVVRSRTPLVHHITNYVTVNDCANACICAGGSPVMTDEAQDVPDIVRISSAVVLNIGTLNQRTVESMRIAGNEADRIGVPVVLDPVGAGATAYRTAVARELMGYDAVRIVKGNSGEISVLAGMEGEVRGVDSVSGAGDGHAAISLARSTGRVVAATGETDYVSDGEVTYAIGNGCGLMERVSGTGCMVSSLVGAYAGACGASLESVAAALTVFSVAGEIAGEGSPGPGTFKARLLDAVHNLKSEDILERAEIRRL